MKCMRTPMIAALAAASCGIHAASLGPDWLCPTGAWRHECEIIPMMRQTDPAGTSVAFSKTQSGAHGAWRVSAAPSIGAKEVGIWFQGSADPKSGFLATLGGGPVGGFALKSADGKTLWEDQWAPWFAYHAYVLEGVVERGRARVQMFEADGETLVSQSPWVEVPQNLSERPGRLALYTRDGVARFWRAARADQPLSPITPDAPNKRRLVQEGSPWTIIGPGNWMWTTGKKERLRQYAVIERTTAINRAVKGVLRTWECRVKVDPGAGGSGMLFQTNEEGDSGLLAWLGGKYGAGSLMLYQLPLTARWSGKQDHWHYNTEYVLRAETRKGQARTQLLEADGKTVIQDTSWVKIPEDVSAHEGHLGFMTWKGTAEFWGFSEATTSVEADPQQLLAKAAQLGGGWETHGDGKWEWTDGDRQRLRQTGEPARAIALNRDIRGSRGSWRCRVKTVNRATAVGLIFQANPDLGQGFACLLTSKGVRFESLDGKALWEDLKVKWAPDREYVLEGKVDIDRVAVRVLSADGETVLTECPDVYVPETNNERTGQVGLLVRGGRAEFWGWELSR